MAPHAGSLFEIRLAHPEEIATLQRIGRDADERFLEAGHPELSGETIPHDAAERAIRESRLWVVARDGEVIGWAMTGRLLGLRTCIQWMGAEGMVVPEAVRAYLSALERDPRAPFP